MELNGKTADVAALADAAWNAFGDVDILINNAMKGTRSTISGRSSASS